MLRNTVASTLLYFYPFGNTPAICLTQSLPVEQDADILLLGCGDVRHVLFTLYSQLGSRKFDFTCCDIEPAIIARNVLLLTLILDDIDAKNAILLWNIYYHVLIDSASLTLLDKHATKLMQYAESLSTWNDGPYGQIIRFCDSHSLSQAKSIWQEYTLPPGNEARQAKVRSLNEAHKKSKGVRSSNWKGGINLTALRSASPTGMKAFQDLPKLHDVYWEKGTLNTGDGFAAAINPNPAMLYSGLRAPTLHYGADPLLGFHLATAYIPFVGSKLSPDEKSTNMQERILEAAQREFQAWTADFSKAARDGKVIVRYFSGDALAFAYTLQAVGSDDRTTTANLYVNNWTFSPLALDDKGYSRSKVRAPTTFNVIDTSNLGDHLGTLNMLMATAPLLREEISSTVSTEILVQHEASVKSTLDVIMCGHFDSVALLLGLAVVETWTNASSAAETDQALLNVIPDDKARSDSRGKQMLTRISWKLTSAMDPSALNLQANDLAKFLHSVYKTMFGHETLTGIVSSIGVSGLSGTGNPFYNRASFTTLLHLLRSNIKTEWSLVFERLVSAIESDDPISVSSNYLQELNTYLHIMNLHSVDVLTQSPQDMLKKKLTGRLTTWPSLPSVIAVTIQVPRSRLTFLTQMKPEKVGIPILNCSVMSPKNSSQRWLNQFGVVQAGFGQVRVEQMDNSGLHHITIDEDENGWAGESSLIVSCLVPTWTLLQAEDSTLVSVGFQTTPHAAQMFARYLDTNLQFFSTELRDQQVHLTEQMPQQQSHAVITPEMKRGGKELAQSKHVARSTLNAVFNSTQTKIQGLARRIDLQGAPKDKLVDTSTAVKTEQKSAMVIEIAIGDQKLSQSFPRPVSAARSRLRVARKSSYVEAIAPLLGPLHMESMEPFVFPVSLSALTSNSADQITPVNLNMHAVNLDILPIIDIKQPPKLEWLTVHTSLMFSGRERKQRESSFSSSSQTDHRVDFKDGLFSMLAQFSGVQGMKARIFGLHLESGGIDTLVFVSNMRFDLNDRAVLLDAAVIPLQHLIMQDPIIRPVLSKMQQVCPPMAIRVVPPELRIWKSILPSLAERCRTWSHNTQKCEYIKHNSIPIPGGLETGNTPLCSCGRGKNLPDGYMKNIGIPGLDKVLKKYATRIAISPVYHVHYVEDMADVPGGAGDGDLSSLLSTLSSMSETRSVSAIQENDRCAACGKTESSDTSLMKCARCRRVRYCSKACQKVHWKEHKLVCS